MTRRLAIVPARGGSKRIPRKNVRPFAGKPMIAHILETARDSGLFQDIHVSTEDATITAVAAASGFAPRFARPAELAGDATPLLNVMQHVAARYADDGHVFDEIWLLFPCAPLLDADDLKAVAETHARFSESRAVLCVGRHRSPIDRAFVTDDDGLLQPVNRQVLGDLTQAARAAFYDSGTCAVFPADRMMTEPGPGWGQPFAPHVLPPHKAVDIDTEEDWAFAELLYDAVRRKSCPAGPVSEAEQ